MLRSLTSNLRKYVPPRLKKISHCVIYILLCCLDWATYILPCWLDCVTYILPCCLDCVTYILPCCYGRWFPTLRKYGPPRLKKMSHCVTYILLCCLYCVTYILPCCYGHWLPTLRKYGPPRLKKMSHCVTYILPCCLDCVTYILPCCYGRWFPTLRKYVPPRLKRMKMSHSLDVINNLKLLLVNSSWVWVVARVWVVAICQLLGNGPDLIQYVSAISYDGLIFRLLTNPSVTFSTRFIAWNKNAYTKSNAHDAFSKSLHQFTLKDQKIGKPIM